MVANTNSKPVQEDVDWIDKRPAQEDVDWIDKRPVQDNMTWIKQTACAGYPLPLQI